ncbi:MAG: hypothetical protein ACI9FJ_002544 [Alteromonadaceae bacterium]|jgi:hypothetical protein
MPNHLITQDNSAVDVSNLAGYWVNVNAHSDFIATLSLAVVNEQLRLSIVSAVTDCVGATTLNMQPISAPGSELAGGFYLFENSTELVIAANEKNGVLVLQSYRPATGVNRGPGQLTREFYYRQLEPVNNQAQFRRYNSQSNCHIRDDFAALSGLWRNTHAQSQWVNSLRVERTSVEQLATTFQLTPSSQSPAHQWPVIELTPYYFDEQELGFVARCCSEGLTSLFTAYSNKGLIVVSAFHRIHKDGPKGKVNHVFVREFYAKQLTV